MPRRHRNAKKGARTRGPKGQGSGWMHGKKGSRDRAPLTPGAMHSKTRRR